MKKISINDLTVDESLYNFLNDEALPGTGLDKSQFWNGFSKIVNDLAPENQILLKKRHDIQNKINKWHLSNKGSKINKDEYFKFLKSIGYIVDEKENFEITTKNVDDEISSVPGPQLVVPVDNARYALNAANARWGSLYDALYGTDVLPGEKSTDYSSERGGKVVSYVRSFLDTILPIDKGSWKDISKIQLVNKNLTFLIGSTKINF